MSEGKALAIGVGGGFGVVASKKMVLFLLNVNIKMFNI